MSEKFNIVERLDSQEDLINYAVDFLTDDDNTVFISEYGTIDEVTNKLFDFDSRFSVVNKTDDEIEFDEIVYIKRISEDIFAIYSVFNNDGNITKEIEGDFVLLEAELLLPNIIDEYVIANEELEICGLNNPNEELEEEQEICEECKDCIYNCNCENEDKDEDSTISINININPPISDFIDGLIDYVRTYYND